MIDRKNVWGRIIKKSYLVVCLLLVAGCGFLDMRDQPRYEPLEASSFFGDGQASRPLVANTVARGQLQADEHFYTGRVGDEFAKTFPFPPSRATLERGRERYDIFCSPCHSRVGDGQGMIVQRGFKAPPSFHTERLRQASPGYLFNVISTGLGAMPSYATQVPPEDRWATVAYIQALQLSQNATLDEAPPAERQRLQGKK